MKLIVFSILLVSVIGIDALNKPKDCQCRLRPTAIKPAIVDGSKTLMENYPWHVRIVERRDGKNENVCAATILNENTLLTATTCVSTNEHDLALYRAVIKDREEIYEIEKIVKHPNFKYIRYNYTENDIAILKLKTNLTMSRLVQPGCFNLRNLKTNKLPLYAAGFGMNKTIIKTKSLTSEDFISDVFTDTQLTDETEYMCPGGRDENMCIVGSYRKNLCLGDTGTAIMANIGGRTNVIGVAGLNFMKKFNETHIALCTIGNRAVKVSAYRSFIEEQVGDDYCHQE